MPQEKVDVLRRTFQGHTIAAMDFIEAGDKGPSL
jgi:hypothetical protein